MVLRKLSLASLLVSAGAALSACNTSAPSATVTPPAAPVPYAQPAAPIAAAAPVAPVPSAPVPAAPVAVACSLQGQWSGTINPGPTPFSNSPVTADYKADHTIDWGTNLARFTGTWQVEGETLHVTDTSSTIPQAACPSSEIGNYRLEWAPACSAVTFRLTADTCDGRRPALSDLRLTRTSS